MKTKRLKQTLWCVLGLIIGIGFIIKGEFVFFGIFLTLSNIWLIYRIHQGDMDTLGK